MRKLTVSPGFMQRSCDNERAAFSSDQPAGRLPGPCGKEDRCNRKREVTGPSP
jgi:hypothetical protein